MIYSRSSLVLLPFFAAVVWYDWQERRIPNWVTGLGLAAGLAAAAGFGAGGICTGADGPVGVSSAALALGLGLLRALGTVILTGGLYALRMVGAGDIKLMAMIVGCLGFRQGGAGILAGLCLGAIWSLAKLVKSGILIHRLHYFADYVQQCAETRRAAPYYKKGEDGKEIIIPLGACIAVGSGVAVVMGAFRL